jgi:hypothetical protein
MIDEIKTHWWWLTALGAAIAGGVRWLFGMQAQIDHLTKERDKDNEERASQKKHIEHLLDVSARTETKLDFVVTHLTKE